MSGLEYLSEPLKKIGIEMYNDVLEFSQEDFESLGIERHEELFHAIHGAGKLRRMTDGSWDANDFAAAVRRGRIACVTPSPLRLCPLATSTYVCMHMHM